VAIGASAQEYDALHDGTIGLKDNNRQFSFFDTVDGHRVAPDKTV
jgi:hypothetical protein